MMQNPLPPIEEFIGDDITEGDFKVALVKLRAYLDELLGTDGEGHNVVPASVGSATKPVYTDANKNIVASDATVGATNKPVYMNGGTITAISGNIGSASQPVYVDNGVLTAGNNISTNYVGKNNGSLAVGSYAILALKHATTALTVANGATTAGSNLRQILWQDGQVSTNTETAFSETSTTKATISGTWRNVSGASIERYKTSLGHQGGLWQRTA